MYTHWGKSKCPTRDGEIVKTVYSGEFDILFIARRLLIEITLKSHFRLL